MQILINAERAQRWKRRERAAGILILDNILPFSSDLEKLTFRKQTNVRNKLWKFDENDKKYSSIYIDTNSVFEPYKLYNYEHNSDCLNALKMNDWAVQNAGMLQQIKKSSWIKMSCKGQGEAGGAGWGTRLGEINLFLAIYIYIE